MGAETSLMNGQTATIKGTARLTGAEVMATDLKSLG